MIGGALREGGMSGDGSPSVVRVRTGAWYADREIDLRFPAGWEVVEHWPTPRRALSEDDLRACVGRPVGQAPLRERCRGKRRVTVIVDDLNRPTPAWRVMPYVLEELRRGGIVPADVTVVMATGTHGAPRPGALEKKAGREAAAACRLEAHDSTRRGRRLGRTSFGTPVWVDATVASADLVVGIGGVYPNHTAGFGGGVKLALGVLSKTTIARLHYRHDELGWGGAPFGLPFRRDLEEIAAMIGLETVIGLQLDAAGAIVRASCGHPRETFEEDARAAREASAVPPPGDADVVVANAYPNDLSLTFAKMKGTSVFGHARAGASRIVVAAMSEGPGHHGLFPVVNPPRFQAQRHVWREMAVLPPGPRARRAGLVLWRRTLGRFARRPAQAAPAAPPAPGPMWICCTTDPVPALPAAPGVAVRGSWDEVLAAVGREQGGHGRLRAALYACTPLQWIDPRLAPIEARAAC
jgi:nickel-dependent lactate racemase